MGIEPTRPVKVSTVLKTEKPTRTYLLPYCLYCDTTTILSFALASTDGANATAQTETQGRIETHDSCFFRCLFGGTRCQLLSLLREFIFA